MANDILWRNTLGVRLGAVILALLVEAFGFVAVNLWTASAIQGDAAAVSHASKGRFHGYQMVILADRLLEGKEEERKETLKELRHVIDLSERRFDQMLKGDAELGVPAATDPEIIKETQQRRELWHGQIRPKLEEVIGLTSATDAPTRNKAREALAELEKLIQSYVSEVSQGIELYEGVQRQRIRWFQATQWLFVVFAVIALGIVYWLGRGVGARARTLATTANRIAGGELTLETPIQGSDELAALAGAFNTMTASLRGMIDESAAEKRRTRAILDSTADGILSLDEKGMVRMINAASSRLFGYADNEVVGRSVSPLVPALYQENARYDDRQLRSGESRTVCEESTVRGHRRDGSTFPLSLRVIEMNHLGERLYIATLQDITRRKQAEDERARLFEAIRDAVNRLGTTSAELLAGTSQQSAGAQEQAAAVSQTVATVDEVTQTSNHAAQRAQSVGDAVQRTQEVGKAGRKAVDDAIAALGTVQERVEATAENILALAEQAQAIGEIIATVNDIAEQTNLLALNAAIEASRAGEHGRGFAVVAGEVKALADQSKKATAQVRQILGEIQKATNTAVLSTEDVTKGVAAAGKVAGQAGQTIKALTDTLSEAAQATAQIVASAGQQATGMAQIHQAMKNIDQVARQNLAAMRQAEQAAQNLNALGTQLTELTAK